MSPFAPTPAPREQDCLLRAADRATKITPEQLARYRAWQRRETTND